MREIIFRGKSRIGNNWKYGYLTKTCEDNGDKYWIDIWNDSYEVDPDTVGQYTGRTDKNGKEIFEGDIVRFNNQIFIVKMDCGSFGLAINENINYDKLLIEIKKHAIDFWGCYCDNFISLFEIYWNFNGEENVVGSVEVIGNIHDNSELLKVENE